MAYVYSDDEIEATLHEMGIGLPDRGSFNQLRENLNNRDDDDREITDDNLTEFMRNLDDQTGRTIRYIHHSWGKTTIDHVQQTIKKAEDLMLHSVDCMANLEIMIENWFDDGHEDKAGNEEFELEPEIPLSPTPYRRREYDDKENVQIEQQTQFTRKSKPLTKRNGVPNPVGERRKIKEFLDKNCLMRASPHPGRPPFKTDRLKLLAKYREEWSKHPNPGETKRLSLRWKIRQLMMRKDIPFIQLRENEISNISRPEWET